MTHQYKIIDNIFKCLDGLHRYEIFDLLQLVESRVHKLPTPLVYQNLTEAHKFDFKLLKPLLIADSRTLILLDSSIHLNLYVQKSSDLFLFNKCMFFTVPNDISIYEFKRDIIQEKLDSEPLKKSVRQFLEHNNLKSKNRRTGRYKLLELLDQIDP